MDDNKFTDEEQQAIRAWIRERLGELTCPLCNHNNWTLGDVRGRIFGDPASGLGYPVVVLVCQRCAYTLTLNAIVMGIEESGGTDDDEGGDDE